MKNDEHGIFISLRSATRFFLNHFALALLATMALSGCGGGGGGSSPASGTNILSGTAAAGAPLANATVTLKDSAGVAETTTADTNGNYSFDVSGKQFPVMLEVQPSIPGAMPLFSASLASGTANITPLTDLQVFEAAGGTDPSTIFKSGDFSQIGNSTLDYGRTNVISNFVPLLTSNGLDPAILDPITTPMVANGVGQDAILDHTSVAITGNNANLTDSAGNCIPFGPLNVTTLAVNGIDPKVLWDSGSGMSDEYVEDNLKKACVPGIDQSFALVTPKLGIMDSNVSWSGIPDAPDTQTAIATLIAQLENANGRNKLAAEHGETAGPINIVAHSWGGIIAYLALSELSDPHSGNYDPTIKVANLITLGTPVECLAPDSITTGDCQNYYLPFPPTPGVPTLGVLVGDWVLHNVPSEFSQYIGPIQVPTNVGTWTNYWGKDDVISARINNSEVKNKYVDCAGNLYDGIISADPTPLPCVISAAEWAAFDSALVRFYDPLSWDTLIKTGSKIASNHMAYFQSPTGGISGTLADIRQIVASSRTDAVPAQGTTPPTSGATTLPPTAFSVIAGNPFCDTTSAATPAMNLSWSVADGVVYYRVFRNGSMIGVNLNASQLSFTDNRGLVAGQSYTYKVWAINSNGTTWSNVVQVTIPAAVCGTTNPAPGNPGNTPTPLSFTSLTPVSLSTSAAPYQPTLTATGANFSNLTQIRFDWSGSTVGSKTWYKSDLDWNSKVVPSSDGSSMTLAPVVVLPGDPPGLTTWTVTLTDTTGATATQAFTVNYMPPSTAPGRFSMSGDATCNTTSPGAPEATLSWIASSGGVTYDVYRNGSLFQSGITGTSFNDSSVAAGQTYSYDIVANNPFGATQSNGVIITVPFTICSVSIPATPTGLSPGSTGSPGQTQASSTVTVSWGASGGAQLYMGGITDIATGSDIVTINTSGTSMAATLGPGKQYRWYVFACNSSGCSRSSALYYFQTPAAASTPTCTTSFNTSSESIDASGGQQQVILTTSDPSCTWSATSNQAWVHNITPSSGTAGATLTYTVDPNSSTQSRSATITAGQATLTVSQLGTAAACTFSLGYTTQSVPADGGTFSPGDGLIASSQSCPRTAQSNAPFITNVSPTSGNGDANISYTVAPNTSTSPRSGTLTIAGLTLTVNQDGAVSTCTDPGAFSLSATPYWDTGSPHSVAASLSWTSSSNATSSYAIYRDGVNIDTVSGTTLLNNPAPPALLAGSNHSYYITASNTCGNTQSNTVSVTLTVQATVSNTGGIGLNLRSAAGYTSAEIANLPDGTIVTVNGGPTKAPISSTSSGWWWQVSTPYGSGWVWGDYLY